MGGHKKLVWDYALQGLYITRDRNSLIFHHILDLKQILCQDPLLENFYKKSTLGFNMKEL